MKNGKMNQVKAGKMNVVIILLVVATTLLLGSCQKEIAGTANNNTVQTTVAFRQFQISSSRVVLLQSNDQLTALNFSWTLSQPLQNVRYTLQAVLNGFSFDEDGVELGSSVETGFSISQKELNDKILKIAVAKKASTIAFRIKAGQSHNAGGFTYSDPMAVVITPYQPVATYQEAQKIRISGNFQNWNLATAPAIVTTENNGQYEGFIQFSNPYPQFLMVKGNKWETTNTYSYIGGDKFGFGGTVLSIFGGKGTYLVQANTNTNTWKYTKITNWNLCGTAVKSNANCQMGQVLEEDGADGVWQITTDLQPGEFRIRANSDNTISFGKSSKAEGTPDYNGNSFQISKAGNYTITLNVSVPGNYYYGIQRNK